MSEVTNPIQACNDIFLKPNGVFKAISEKDNWSWLPFFIVVVFATVPGYLYFGIVDFDWFQTMQIQQSMPDASPAEIESYKAASSADMNQMIVLISGVIGLIIVAAVQALYHTLVTRNDEKSIHSFLDWYGAQWWMFLPSVLSALAACVLILLLEPGAQQSEAILAPFSLAYIFGVEKTSSIFSLMMGIRLESIWSIYLASVCISQWTNFSKQKSVIVAVIPTLIILGLTAAFTL